MVDNEIMAVLQEDMFATSKSLVLGKIESKYGNEWSSLLKSKRTTLDGHYGLRGQGGMLERYC